jgi:hypothetical protein
LNFAHAIGYRELIKKRGWRVGVYFLVFGLSFAFAALMGFIGSPQHTSSHAAQPQGSSTKTISPHSSHLYFSPFFFAKNLRLL